MAYSTGEIIPTPGLGTPFKVVFSIGGEIINEWPVSSREEGERQIVQTLRGLRAISESEGTV